MAEVQTKVIGVDLGGTQIRTALADGNGRIIRRRATLTQAQEGPAAVLERMRGLIRDAIGESNVAALGVGAPGPTDPYEGIVMVGPNLPGWRNVNLRNELDGFDAPVFVGNDANLAGLAEHRFGAGKGCRHMIYITVSTGIGTGVIVDNQMLLGTRGLAAELGHMTIDLDAEKIDAPDDETLVGTLEGLASGPNLTRRARAKLRQGESSKAVDLAGGSIDAVTPGILNEAAQAGDEFASRHFRETGRYLGVGITNMLHIFNPERIVIGGSVWLHARELLEESMWETIRARAESPEYWRNLKIVPAALGDDVGLLGAVALALDGLRGVREA